MTYQEAFGRSRGGFTTRIHARAHGQGRPLGFVLTGREASDDNAVPGMLEIPVSKPRLFLADKGYGGEFLREELLLHGIRPVILPKANRKTPPAEDYRAHKHRNRIERIFNRLKQFRRVATRYDKTRKIPFDPLTLP
ncbi:transposase IS4 family protein [Rhizobium sp. PDO1-076]|uniref:IS5 family transposase n=1 Tax=Rhizobium sp. PDO1-076 TaxID=1125979 RepID=UPI00024E3722|nr:IS5 family transposase [Rhizobium sp. PDO1-076]EHS53415.1 transposase IS4 family protein [Rhizobium sp. PDO1-076]